MASSEDPPDPNDSYFRNLHLNPFKLLGLSSEDLEPEDVRKAYKTKIRTSHPDKAKGKEGLAKKLTAAYNFLKRADAEKLKELAQQFSNPSHANGGTGVGQTDLSHVLVDKTKGEHYRRLFKAHLNVAKETQFKDNFQSFYKQVFDDVSTQPADNTGYHCALCDEDFILEEDHFELVYSPYSEYLLGGAELEFWEYLETVLDTESLKWAPAVTDTGKWSTDTLSTYFRGWCEKLEALKNGQCVEQMGKPKSQEEGVILDALFSVKGQSAEDICAKVMPLLPKSLDILNLLDLELILPAFLKVNKDFQDWHQLSSKLCTASPRLSVILASVGAFLHPDREDNFLQLGESLIKSNREFGYAHLCFLLGSCDLSHVAQKIISLSSHIECKRLAAYFLTKTSDLSKLENLGKAAMKNGDVDTAAAYFIPLIKHYYNSSDGDNLITILGHILPGNKYWKAVQALVLDIPDFILNCDAVAMATVQQIGREMKPKLDSILDLIMGALGGHKISSVSVPAGTMSALSGALHILRGDDEQYTQAMKLIMEGIKRQLDMKLDEGDAAFIVEVAQIPGILPVIKQILQHKQFLGPNAIKDPVTMHAFSSFDPSTTTKPKGSLR